MDSNNIKTNGNIWNILADRFNTYKKGPNIHPDAAVNIEVGWPLFLDLINDEKRERGKKSLQILDFGCGTGEFCKCLADLGHKVTGIDHSKKMLEIATSHLSGIAEMLHGNHGAEFFGSKVNQNRYDIVTAMHSLEWIEDIDSALANLAKVIVSGGLLVFAVFPKDHVRDSLYIKDLFEDFDSLINPSFGYANFDGVRVPVWIRSQEVYDELLRGLGLTRTYFNEPGYPKGFFEKYNWTGSKYPEMMVLAYRKD